jgi:hypothetical protein
MTGVGLSYRGELLLDCCFMVRFLFNLHLFLFLLPIVQYSADLSLSSLANHVRSLILEVRKGKLEETLFEVKCVGVA